MEYRIVRSRRKTIAVVIDRHGNVVAKAPLYVSDKAIDDFVQSKKDWIETHVNNVAQATNERIKCLEAPPEWLPLMGEKCPVVHTEPYGYGDGVFHLPENMELERLLPYLRKLYADIAKKTLPYRTKLIADRMHVKINEIKVNSAKTRWGSCSSNGNVNLSWKLIAAKSRVIDYVIVHELCHVEHMNHSPEFWAKVESILPDYKELREELSDVQKMLSTFGLD